MLLTIDDGLSPDGAEYQAHQIQKFWRRKGYHGIRVWIVSEVARDGHLIYGVRSNIKNGFPPRAE